MKSKEEDIAATIFLALLLSILLYIPIGWGFSWFWNTFLPLPPMLWWQGWISAIVLSFIFSGNKGLS